MEKHEESGWNYQETFIQPQGLPRQDKLKKSARCKLDNATRDPRNRINDIKLIMGDLKKLNIHIYYTHMMTHMLSNLTEAYNNMIKIYKTKWMTMSTL